MLPFLAGYPYREKIEITAFTPALWQPQPGAGSRGVWVRCLHRGEEDISVSLW